MPLDIQPGDHITIRVPVQIIGQMPSYGLAPNTYECSVIEVKPAECEGPGALTLLLRRPVGPFRNTPFTIIPLERLAGYGFIGADCYPVPYTHEPDLTTRMQQSITYIEELAPIPREDWDKLIKPRISIEAFLQDLPKIKKAIAGIHPALGAHGVSTSPSKLQIQCSGCVAYMYISSDTLKAIVDKNGALIYCDACIAKMKPATPKE